MSYCSRSCRRRLPYWTPEVEHLAAFAAIVTNILLRMRRNGYLGTSGKRFGDLATFFVDFCILYAECPPYFYFWFVWPTDLESIRHASTPRSIILTSFKLIWPHTAQLNSFCLLIRHVTFWPWPLTFWPWTVVIHGGSRAQPCHQVWRPYAYPFMSYEL